VGPFVFLHAALVGFFAFAGVYHLILWGSSRRGPLLAVFSIDCLLRALFSGVLAAIATADTPEAAHDALRLRLSLGMLVAITSLWSVSLYSDVRPVWYVWPVTICLATLFVIQTFVMPLNATVLAIEPMVFPWGESISNPVLGPPGWWFGPLYALVISLELFGLYCGIRLWSSDRIAARLIVLIACLMLAIHVLFLLRGLGVVMVPFFGVIPHVFWISIVALLIARGHRRTREELAASENRFRTLGEQASDGIFICDAAGRCLEVNAALCGMLGYARDELLQLSLGEVVLADDLACLTGECIPGAGSIRCEWRFRRSDGTLVEAEVNARQLPDRRLLGVVRDITQRKRAEAQRRSLESQLAQAQKMEAIGRLSAGVAHDFNNLLTVINGNCELLLERTPHEQQDRVAMLRCIHDAGEQAATLTRRLLTFSHQQVVEPQLVDVNAVIGNIAALLQRLSGDGVQLVTVLGEQLGQVQADPAQLGQVLVNLAVNARDAMPQGGTLTIETRNVSIDDAYPSEHDAVPAGTYVLLSVTDTGCGMTPEMRARIFEAFFTTKAPGKGTGIGLATVQTIVDESRGFIAVESEPGHGSTFRIYLPVVAVPIVSVPVVTVPASSLSDEVPQKDPPRGDETILLVEDDAEVRAVTLHFLRQAGYEVLEAGDGAEALAICEQHAGRIDLLVTDLVLPQLSGEALARHVALARPGIKVLCLSGYTDEKSAPDQPFLQKPFSPKVLVAKVREVLDQAPA
jgi:PAS domain S-box-containing protein